MAVTRVESNPTGCNGWRRRHRLATVFTATALGGLAAVLVAAPGVPSATAADDPCSASEMAKTIGMVALNTGDYLESHPQTDQALTTIAGQSAGPQMLGSLKNYLVANPRAAADLHVIQQPALSLSARCNLPISLPQLLGVTQAVEQAGPAAGLPAAVAPAPSLPGNTATGSDAVSARTPATGVGTGRLPGPAVHPGQ